MRVARVICALVLFLALISSANAQTSKLLEGESLELTSREPHHISGTFVHREVIVRFDSMREENHIELKLSDREKREIYAASSDGKTYSISFYAGMARATGSVPSPAEERRKHPAALARPAVAGDESAVRAFGESAEYRTLPFLSRALAVNGIFGTTHAASLYLHGLGLSSAQINKINIGIEDRITVQKKKRCQDQSSDPCHNDCFGMCGNGCSCWKWVCGDCCIHVGCLTHDVTCRLCDCGFLSHIADCVLCYTAISFLGAHPCTLIHGCQTPPSCD